MDENKNIISTIDEYINQFSPDVQEKLQAIRQIIRENAPQAKEKISWQMPTYDLYGNLVHFAANKSHLGFYPGASGVENFLDKLAEYKNSKGAIQFPYSKPLPAELVAEIVRFRVAENKKYEEYKEEYKKEKKQSKKNKEEK
ncbi:hypothetical protein OXPF_30080 [Oxobacter pfennigii]|uniref:YdhG-like domain-containing protein n=1 Tax=Oxobacter pfennigii TaxID=36849 RepID=A0A0P8W4Q6_9CLOT|nr:DUF1801 domain-containing protein [Oxobacter pfennigii]KPU43567.1 hypothetical protein OXPF_30080 [Oxobacter pfennigii]